jgi:hypothetical protein
MRTHWLQVVLVLSVDVSANNSFSNGGELQTEEHIVWDCKLYEDERASVMDILSENIKKGIHKVS